MKKQLLILTLILSSSLLFALGKGDGIKKNATRDEGEGYYVAVKTGSEEGRVKMLYDDLFVSVGELQNIFQFSNSSKKFEKFRALNIDRKSDKDYRYTFHKRFYAEIIGYNYSRIDSLVEFFRGRANEKGWTEEELASHVVEFVQNIEYERPMNIVKDKRRAENHYDFFTPNQLLFNRKGECESKSLLLALLLNRLDYETVILWSDKFKHVMVGLESSVKGTSYSFEERDYIFVEATAPQEIGKLSEEWSDIAEWRAVPLGL